MDERGRVGRGRVDEGRARGGVGEVEGDEDRGRGRAAGPDVGEEKGVGFVEDVEGLDEAHFG